MNIHLNYDENQNNGIIFNAIYPNGALFEGAEYKPNLSFAYDGFQYSEVMDAPEYIIVDGVRGSLTAVQIAEIKAVAENWIQPIGQEGNPNAEQIAEQDYQDWKRSVDEVKDTQAREAYALGTTADAYALQA